MLSRLDVWLLSLAFDSMPLVPVAVFTSFYYENLKFLSI